MCREGQRQGEIKEQWRRLRGREMEMFRERQREKLRNGKGDRKGKVEWHNNTLKKNLYSMTFFINLFMLNLFKGKINHPWLSINRKFLQMLLRRQHENQSTTTSHKFLKACEATPSNKNCYKP